MLAENAGFTALEVDVLFVQKKDKWKWMHYRFSL